MLALSSKTIKMPTFFAFFVGENAGKKIFANISLNMTQIDMKNHVKKAVLLAK